MQKFKCLLVISMLPIIASVLCANLAHAQDLLPPTPIIETQPEDPPVAKLFAERAALQDYLLSIDKPDTKAFLDNRDTRLGTLGDKLDAIRSAVDTEALTQLSFEALVDYQSEIRNETRNLSTLFGQLSARATLRDTQLDELSARSDKWQALTRVAKERDAPASVLEVANDTATAIEETRLELLADRDAALEDLSVMADLRMTVARLDDELSRRRAELEAVSQTAADAPLWSRDVWTGRLGLQEAGEAWSRYWLTIVSHVLAFKFSVPGLFLALWLGAHWLLKLTGERVRTAMQNNQMGLRALAVFDRPSSAALLTGLLGVAWFGPAAPTAFSNLLWAIMPFPAAALAVRVFAKPIRLTIFTIAAVLAMMSLKFFFDPMPLVSRFGLLVEALLTLSAIWVDYKKGNVNQAFPAVRPLVIRWFVRVVCAALLFVIAAEIAGSVGLATTMRSLLLGSLGIGMIFTSITYVLTGLVLAIVHIRPFSTLSVVRNQRWTIVTTSRKWIRYLMALLWLTATLSYAGLLDKLLEHIDAILNAELHFGAITIHVSAVVAGLVILFSTWLINKIIGFVLAGKSMSGSSVAAGISFAVSKLLRYAIAVIGFGIALVAMGVDLTQVTIVAGALSVGIGLGLQNIANNFVSGLILLFERPIKINDIAKIDELMGTVKELGIRATVIETFDGAEVIVPNADLISKVVTNWTKSNRRRRAEIEVGVAYGSNPQRVLDILERAAKDNEAVIEDPEPFAVFVGFGDSSLNFRLYVWLSDLNQVVRAPGKIRQKILDELNAAGIEIPFPQRDIRVTMLPDPAQGTDDIESGSSARPAPG